MKEVFERGKKACLLNLPSSSTSTNTVSESEEEKSQALVLNLTFDLQSTYHHIEDHYFNKLLTCPGCGVKGLNFQGYCRKTACVAKRDLTIGTLRQHIKCLGCDKGGHLHLGYCQYKKECQQKRHAAGVFKEPTKCLWCESTNLLRFGYCKDRICLKSYKNFEEIKKRDKDRNRNNL